MQRFLTFALPLPRRQNACEAKTEQGQKLCIELGMLVLATWLQQSASSFLVCLSWLLLLLFFVAALLKTSSHEKHARLNAKLFELCSASASQAKCLRSGGRASSNNFALSLACCSWPLGFSGVPEPSIAALARCTCCTRCNKKTTDEVHDAFCPSLFPSPR